MSRKPPATSYERERTRQDKVIAKIQRIQGKRALLEMWEERPDQVEHDYLLALRQRVRSAQHQYDAMHIHE